MPDIPPVEQRKTQPDDDIYTSELEKLLAEIDETPPLKQWEETADDTELSAQEEEQAESEADEAFAMEQIEEIIAETNGASAMEQEKETEMKADKKQEEANEVMADQEDEGVLSEPEEKAAFPQMQNVAGNTASSAGGAIEQWFHSIAEEKISQIIANHDFNKTIEAVAKDVVPKIAEELVAREIERIKQKIVGD